MFFIKSEKNKNNNYLGNLKIEIYLCSIKLKNKLVEQDLGKFSVYISNIKKMQTKELRKK